MQGKVSLSGKSWIPCKGRESFPFRKKNNTLPWKFPSQGQEVCSARDGKVSCTSTKKDQKKGKLFHEGPKMGNLHYFYFWILFVLGFSIRDLIYELLIMGFSTCIAFCFIPLNRGWSEEHTYAHQLLYSSTQRDAGLLCKNRNIT